MVSVPDLMAVCRMYTNPSRTLQERFHLMRIIYGGHVDEYDYHFVGFDFQVLRNFLLVSGYADVRRMTGFGMFQDSSELVLFDEPVSLNIEAFKPKETPHQEKTAAVPSPSAETNSSASNAPSAARPPENCQVAPKISHVFGPRERLLIHPTVDVQSAFFNTISGTISVERFVMFGHHVKLLTGTHDITKTGPDRIRSYPTSGRDIVVEEGAWLASECIVLGSVRIGRNAVIAAGSVVTRSVPPNEIWGGNPARRLRALDARSE